MRAACRVVVLSAGLGLLAAQGVAAVQPGEKCHRFTATVEYAGTPAENVPVLLRLSSAIPGFDYADFINDGRDLEIADDGGESLPFEIDTWNTNGESLVWVKMPVFETNRTLTVTYGRSVADGTSQATDVWGNYTGVWHINDTNSASTFGTYPNSTAVAGIDALKAKRSLADEPGRFGKSVRITKNGTEDYTTSVVDGKTRLCHGGVFVPDSGDNSPLDVGDTKTLAISGWFKHTGSVPSPYETYGRVYNYDRFFFKRRLSKDTSAGGFALQMLSDDTPSLELFVSASSSQFIMNLEPLTNWTHFAFVFRNREYFVYTNGAPLKSGGSLGVLSDNNDMLAFGNCHMGYDDGANEVGDGIGERAWNGWIDEVRLTSRTFRSAEYIAAEYAAMAGNVIRYGAVVEEDNDADRVALADAPGCHWSESCTGMVFSAVVSGGRGRIVAEYRDLSSGTRTTNLVATVDGTETFPLVVTSAVPVLAEGRMYKYTAILEGKEGTTPVRKTGGDPFYYGQLTVTCRGSADEAWMSNGTFRIARANTAEAKIADLVVPFELSGTAVEQGAFHPPVSTVANLSAGKYYVDVTIAPIYNTNVTVDTTIVLTMTGDNVLNPSLSSAEMTVLNTSENLHVRYVSPSGSDSVLGCSPSAPKRSIGEAVKAIEATAPEEICVVHVAPGEYPISETISIRTPTHVIGEGPGPDAVVVTNASTSTRVGLFAINNKNARVTGLTMTGGLGGSWERAGFFIDMEGGLVSNCIVRGCSMVAPGAFAAGGCLINGLVTHTVFRDLTCTVSPWNTRVPLVLELTGEDKTSVGGVAENCLIENCTSDETLVLVSLKKPLAALRNCTIANSWIGGDGTNVYNYGGQCSTGTTAICAVHLQNDVQTGMEVRNVVAAGSYMRGMAPLPLVGGTVANIQRCVTNCATDAASPLLPAGTILGTAEEFFRDPANGDFRPTFAGPLVDAGSDYVNMPATDLLFRPRKNGKAVDIGCYENIPVGFDVRVR